MNRHLLYIYATIAALLAVAKLHAESVITGCNPTYAGKTLELCKYNEKIINSHSVVSTATVDTVGCFSFAVDVKEPVQLFINGEAQRGFFICYPNKNYQIEIPNYKERTIAQKLQPFYTPDEYLVMLTDISKEDANYKVLELEDALDFYNLKVLHSGHNLDTLEAAEKDIVRIFKDFDNDGFLKAYRDYRLLLLYNQFSGNEKTAVACKQLSDLGVSLSNPAFWDAFNSVFNEFVANTVGTEDYFIFKKIIDDSNAKMFVQHLRVKYQIKDTELLELASIKILADVVQNRDYNTQSVLKMLNNLSPYISVKNRPMLADILFISSRGIMGTSASDLVCLDKDGKKHRLGEIKDKFIYLNFCSSRLQRCEKDLRILERFAATFPQQMVVVNVFLYEDQSRIKRIAETFGKGLKNWEVWYAEDSDMARKAYNARSIPSYFLIDNKGTFLLSRNAEPNDETRYLLLHIFGMDGEQGGNRGW